MNIKGMEGVIKNKYITVFKIGRWIVSKNNLSGQNDLSILETVISWEDGFWSLQENIKLDVKLKLGNNYLVWKDCVVSRYDNNLMVDLKGGPSNESI